MISENMFQKTLEVRSTSIWEHFEDTEIFALDLPSKERGYIAFFSEREVSGIGIYRGASGLSSYMAPFLKTHSDHYYTYITLQQRLLEICFLNVDDPSLINSEVIKDIEAYERYTGHSLEEGEYLPRLVRMEPFRTPMSIASPSDEADLLAVMDVVLYLARHLSPYGYVPRAKQAVGIYPRALFTSHNIPLFRKKDDKYSISMIHVPVPKDFFYKPALPPEDLLAYLRQQKGSPLNDMTVALRVTDEPFASFDTLSNGIYPPILMQLKKNPNSINAPIVTTSVDERGLDLLLGDFCESLVDHGKPETIYYGEESANAFLREFCESAGINLKEDDSAIRLIDIAFGKLMEKLLNESPEQLKHDYDMYMNMSNEELHRLSPQVRKFLLDNYEYLPERLQKNLKRLIS